MNETLDFFIKETKKFLKNPSNQRYMSQSELLVLMNQAAIMNSLKRIEAKPA